MCFHNDMFSHFIFRKIIPGNFNHLNIDEDFEVELFNNSNIIVKPVDDKRHVFYLMPEDVTDKDAGVVFKPKQAY